MTDQFKDYSKYYDTIYQGKEYRSEVGFVLKVFKKYRPLANKNILSLGCGTCTYEILMARKGYKITGIDRSPEMLSLAAEKIATSKLASQIKIFNKDIRDFSFKAKYDYAMAMFNIAGYLIANTDVEKMFDNVYKSLRKGGIFVFDCWYMPAVLKDKPTDRIKKINTKVGSLIRLTKSVLRTDKNTIEINFNVIETEKGFVVGETNETHMVRYWSLPELEYFLNKSGFVLEKACNFMDLHAQVSDNVWNIFIVARKK